MADNVAITAGTGTSIATDEVQVDGNTLGHVQYVKLVDGTLNGTAAIPGGSDGLDVVAHRELKRIAVPATGLTTTTPTYTAGDQVGAQFTFANAARVSGGSGTIVGVVMQSYQDVIGAVDFVIFDSSVTLAGDNAAFNLATDTDVLKVVGLVQLAGAFDLGANRIAQAFNLAIPFVCSGSASLFGSLITRSSHAVFAASPADVVQMVLYIEWN